MNPVIEQWNAAAKLFAADQEQSEFAFINKEVVKERFSKFDGEKILDLGCGYGFYTDYFDSIGAHTLGCDGSDEMLALARDNYPESIFESVDIERALPYENEQFDLVFCNQVLMDIENLDTTISEIGRITKKSGIFYMSIVHPAFYDCRWDKDEQGFRRYKIMERYLSEYAFDNEYWGKTRHYHRTVSYYVNLCIRHGFQLVCMNEPVSYDGVEKSNEFPLFLFLEFIKQ